MSARRVAYDHHATQVELVLRRDRSQVIDAVCDIEICTRPAAPRLPESTILDVPCRDALRLESVAYLSEIAGLCVGRLEAATVNEDHDWMRPRTCRHSELAVLTRVRAVRNALVWWLSRE